MCVPPVNLLGGVVSAAGALASASAQSSQAKAQAKFAERQAEIERQRGSVDAARRQREGKRIFGGRIAGFAKGGVSLDGSPTTVLSNIQAENELDTDRIRLSSRLREDQQRFSANANRARAKSARTQGVLNALSPLINSFR